MIGMNLHLYKGSCVQFRRFWETPRKNIQYYLFIRTIVSQRLFISPPKQENKKIVPSDAVKNSERFVPHGAWNYDHFLSQAGV